MVKTSGGKLDSVEFLVISLSTESFYLVSQRTAWERNLSNVLKKISDITQFNSAKKACIVIFVGLYYVQLITQLFS